MIKIVDRIPMHIRVGMFYLLSFLIWCNISLRQLLSGQHNDFQNAGSLVIVWAIIIVGRRRLQYEYSVSVAERRNLVAALDRLEAHRSLNETRLNLTFDLHRLQISRISQRLGIPNLLGPEAPRDIEIFAEKLDATVKSLGSHFIVREDATFAESVKRLAEARNIDAKWRNYTFTCELSFSVIGTLQWGYGAHFSKWFFELAKHYGFL